MITLAAEDLPKLMKSRRVPVTAQLEITSQCHLTCEHCKSIVYDRRDELDTATWKAILTDLKKMGTMSLVFTGGEAFLRPDLLELLAFADGLQFKLNILTSATLITRRKMEELAALRNLKRIYVSIYALRPSAHQAVTQASTWKTSLRTLLAMRRMGLPAMAQAVLMAPNWRDFLALKDFFDERGIPFRYSMLVVPRDDGFTGVQAMRAPTHAVAHLSRTLKPFHEEDWNCGTMDPDGPVCSMGRTVVGVTSRGEFLPCPAFRMPFGSLAQGPLPDQWLDGPGIRRMLAMTKRDAVCHDCDYNRSCFHCAGLNLAEAGNDPAKMTYPKTACELTYARKRGALIGC